MREREIKRIEELEDSHWWFLAKRELTVTLIKKYFKPGAKAKALEIGCAVGRFLQELSAFGAVSGIDISSYGIEACRRKGFSDTYQEDVLKMHFASGTFDLVCALDVLEHIQDDSGALVQAHRVLKPGGMLLLTVPANKFIWGPHDLASSHKRRYCARELKDKLIRAGFRIERMTHFVSLLSPLIFIYRFAHRCFTEPGKPEATFAIFPGPINRFLLSILRAENRFIARGFDLPFGVSLLCAAVKE